MILETGWLGFLGFEGDAVLTKKLKSIMERKMGLQELLFAIIVIGITYIVYKIIIKKLDRWDG